MQKFPIFANDMLFYASGSADTYKIVFTTPLDAFHHFIKNKPCVDEFKPF